MHHGCLVSPVARAGLMLTLAKLAPGSEGYYLDAAANGYDMFMHKQDEVMKIILRS